MTLFARTLHRALPAQRRRVVSQLRSAGAFAAKDMHLISVWQSVAVATAFFSTSSMASSVTALFNEDDEKSGSRNAVVDMYYSSGDAQSSHLLYQEIHRQASGLADSLVETRRSLHQVPEVMYQEAETSAFVQNALKDLGISYSTGWGINKNPDVHPGPGGYGIVADIGTGAEPCVLLRADMDGLPIHERTDFPHRSLTGNTMHACGHDGHTTMLLGAAAVLKNMEDSLIGTVRLIFQPAEEGGAGGKRMREEGVLELAPKPQHAMAMHVWPTLPSGSIASRPGALLAASERFEAVIHGVGGHAAMPHLTIDPIVTASAIIMNLQSIVSRNINPLDSGVCSVTKIQAGEAFNIIPASVTLGGTIRALSTESLLALRDRIQSVVEATALAYGCNATLEYSRDFYPPTVNDPELFESFSKHVGAMVSAEGFLREIEPTMGAEDFSFLAESIPSTFYLLGQGSGQQPRTDYGLHHPEFALDESILSRGVELHVNWAVRALRKLEKGDALVAY